MKAVVRAHFNHKCANNLRLGALLVKYPSLCKTVDVNNCVDEKQGLSHLF